MMEKYLAYENLGWSTKFVNWKAKLHMISEMKLLEKVQNKKAQKTLQLISEI